MKHPMKYLGTYPSNWAGYVFKEKLGYTTGVHTGTDYNHGTDDLGDPVYAVASGKVVDRILDGQVRGFGNGIIIETDGTPPGVKGNKLYHRYLHLNTVHVRKGQNVKMGQKIATVGTTGGVRAHLHLDTWTDRNGLGAHRRYHKNTQLASYEDPYLLIKNNPTWNGEDMYKNKTAKQWYDWGKTQQRYFRVRKKQAIDRAEKIKLLEKRISSTESSLRNTVDDLNKKKKEIEALQGLNEGLRKQNVSLDAQLSASERAVEKNIERIEELEKELKANTTRLTGVQHILLGVKILANKYLRRDKEDKNEEKED